MAEGARSSSDVLWRECCGELFVTKVKRPIAEGSSTTGVLPDLLPPFEVFMEPLSVPHDASALVFDLGWDPELRSLAPGMRLARSVLHLELHFTLPIFETLLGELDLDAGGLFSR